MESFFLPKATRTVATSWSRVDGDVESVSAQRRSQGQNSRILDVALQLAEGNRGAFEMYARHSRTNRRQPGDSIISLKSFTGSATQLALDVVAEVSGIPTSVQRIGNSLRPNQKFSTTGPFSHLGPECGVAYLGNVYRSRGCASPRIEARLPRHVDTGASRPLER
eukprot:CAMPEP_0197403482 /NCGR_PEP_ID=MMETSP1165-20131217/21596_1 /TAXON_ID=284809 /ORGANISM="Chrysocystis fragilis, Strain CCMP3189" /LENGTH=164 /DNA_ID=CAMNT_0042929693 /DNA_START=12 /DNA_END=504 /DNA_ORIENTATION=-